jgi:hypothetical protein
MFNNLIAIPRLLIFSFFVFSIFSIETPAQYIQSFTAVGLTNPVTKIPGDGCAADNLRAERFVSEMTAGERVKLCQALDKVTGKLNQTVWSPALSVEIKSIWQVFSSEAITLRPMPKGISPQMRAMAQSFPDGSTGGRFSAAVYVRSAKSTDDSFFQILLHELRHVLDFHQTWKNKTALGSMEIERRAFLLVSKLTEETPEKERFSGVAKLWKESWRNRPAAEITLRRNAAIDKYLHSGKFYRDMAGDPNRQKLDFSHLENQVQSSQRLLSDGYAKKDGVRLPVHQKIPLTVAVLPQNIGETNFNLEKPKNPRDEKEILRVALSNEKKLYYGMSNFVYDQKLAFQCLKEGRISASFAENHTVARTGNGNALFKLTAAPVALPCVLNYADLETDFTNTFWASPALEKMPINFIGFRQIDGVTLAVYSVLEPDARLFAQLADEYPQIRPFRVVVGTIYVSPEDGQIVRFGGTSFPETAVTGVYARRVRCTYWVKAVRQKLNIKNGLWVTVHVGTVAVASVRGKVHSFGYTVKFENYRQSETDVKILDDEEAVALTH